jgi:hypothetical protein
VFDAWSKSSPNCKRKIWSLVRCLEVDTLSRRGAFGRLSAVVELDSLARVGEVKHRPAMKINSRRNKSTRDRWILSSPLQSFGHKTKNPLQIEKSVNPKSQPRNWWGNEGRSE